MLPNTLGRHHILMAHQQNRFLAALTLPIIQQIAVNFRPLQVSVNQRKLLLQHAVKRAELVRLVHTGVRGGITAHHGGQLVCEPQGLLLRFLGPVGGNGRRSQQGVHHGDQQQQQQEPEKPR